MLRQADKLLTVGEVALRLRQAETTIRRKLATGEIPGAVNIGSGPRAPLRVPAGELERWLYSTPRPEGEAALARRPSRPSGREVGA